MNTLHVVFCAAVALAMSAGISPVGATDREPVDSRPAVATGAPATQHAQAPHADEQRRCYSQPGARQPAFDLRCPTR